MTLPRVTSAVTTSGDAPCLQPLLEVAWKLIWLSMVALPRYVSGDLDAATQEVSVSCSLVVVIIAVTPWRHVWRHHVRASGDRWR